MRTLIAMLVLSGCTHAWVAQERYKPGHEIVIQYHAQAQGMGHKEAKELMKRKCGGDPASIIEEGMGEYRGEGMYVPDSRIGWIKFRCGFTE